ncbi:ankyrin repeat domain-containing protein [Actinomadura sp. 9N407]|uniref:ankyrin repeat domain-containing protein n=1 Tax=Actinomadura sp. 9N407 TaxID=3375154 RepID=UPI00378F150A
MVRVGPFTGQVAAGWERERRYGVPRWVIERATGRRVAGDWRGACAAAGIEVGFELGEVRRKYGAAVAEALEEDLRHLAPDLLRWHVGDGGNTQVLSEYRPGDSSGPEVSFLRSGDFPMLRLAGAGRGGSMRPCLGFGQGKGATWFTPRHLWDVRRAGELLVRGGGRERAPFFNADGTLREELPGSEPEGAVEQAEWISSLHERGEVEAAFAAAGIELRLWRNERLSRDRRLEMLRLLPIALYRVEAEVRRLAPEGARTFVVQQSLDQYGPAGRAGLLLELPEQGNGLRAMYPAEAGRQKDVPQLPEMFWHRLPDLDLVRAGRLTPDELHPLVRDALFPAREPAAGPVGPREPEPPGLARVRCQGKWHEVSFRNGRLCHDHTDQEWQREHAMRALGGAVAGCFAVREEWAGRGALPRALREQRRELFWRASYGDTEGVFRLLDLGHDPFTRDGEGRSLLHCLSRLEYEELLPRLLDAGLDIEARDAQERTPLMAAIVGPAPAATVRALLDAGARADPGHPASWPAQMLDRRDDLDFLKERLS